MIFHDAKIKGLTRTFLECETKLKKLGFVRWAWDYKKASYDYKITHNQTDYYLRIPGSVVNDKLLENNKAILKLQSPIFTRHFFPHGLDDSVELPEDLKEQTEQLLEQVAHALNAS